MTDRVKELAAADELERLARIVRDAEAVLGRRNLLGGSMKVYIAGKITGCENYEARFAEAARFVQGLGHVALNPVVLPAGLSKADYMRICFAMIDSADEVWTLPNATDSPGATLEIQYCAYTGKPVRTLRTVQEEAESTARDKRLQAAERSDREKKVAVCKAAHYRANKEKIAAYQAAYYQANKEKIAARRKERRDAEKRRGGDGEADGPGAADAGAGVHTAQAGA